jgi:putative (di)nucleoside polyphosphate hydrolase
MIDSNGFRLNVGIILVGPQNRLFFARRIGQNAWQFPQGGIHECETLKEALFRELYEEVGLQSNDVEIIACSRYWLKYRLPPKFIRRGAQPLCIGQKQKWFMLRLLSDETQVQLNHTDNPEFDAWRWVNYWDPLKQVINFKKRVYRRALEEFAPLLSSSS